MGRKKSREEINQQQRDWYKKKKETNPDYVDRFREKKRLYRQNDRLNNPDKNRLLRLKEYAIRVNTTLEHVLSELDRLKGKCDCCGKMINGKFYLDHDHKTNKFRGIVCCSCNIGLGHLDKDGWFDLAFLYLSKDRT